MKLVRPTGVAAIAVASSLTLAACGGGIGGASGSSESDTFTIGFVTTDTGSLADFSTPNNYVVKQMTAYFKDHPIKAGDKEYKVKIVTADSQSDTSRAGQVAADLINNDGANLLISDGTPTIDNPVSEQCEANSVPCLTSVSPWQPFAIRSGSKPADLKWSHHFFWGLEDVAQIYANIWKAIPNNGKAAGLFPNDADGTAWAANFPTLTKDSGVTINNPGAYTDGTKDFSAQISKFKGDDVIVGLPIPPDFTTFWKQAAQQGFKPKVATIGKAMLFPSVVESVGKIGNNVSTEVWWHPTSPFTSSLTGQTSQELADAYEKETGKQWSQPLGFAEALFEVAAAAVQKAGSTDAAAINTALGTLSVDTIVGKVAWGADPNVPAYVAKTPVAGGQWRLSTNGKHPFDLVIVENSLNPKTPLGGKPEALTW
ncbi:ABC transporter substrate-binding protein [Nocardioides sp.]|uniref:ABC transporter substrate-binding protein n=1 Tax=Nocardioides sp. TaxID=35761 RepID=UPI00261134F2|nr:ABC transporter substrate-binding protein [Nocardioides sp.]